MVGHIHSINCVYNVYRFHPYVSSNLTVRAIRREATFCFYVFLMIHNSNIKLPQRREIFRLYSDRLLIFLCSLINFFLDMSASSVRIGLFIVHFFIFCKFFRWFVRIGGFSRISVHSNNCFSVFITVRIFHCHVFVPLVRENRWFSKETKSIKICNIQKTTH